MRRCTFLLFVQLPLATALIVGGQQFQTQQFLQLPQQETPQEPQSWGDGADAAGRQILEEFVKLRNQQPQIPFEASAMPPKNKTATTTTTTSINLQSTSTQISIMEDQNSLTDNYISPRDTFSAIRFTVATDDEAKDVIDYDDYIDALDFVESKREPEQNNKDIEHSFLAKHHNYDEMYQYLLDLSKKYPDITRLESIGQSVQGRDLWALEVSQNPGEHKDLKPEVRYVANIHGNEVVGKEMLLDLARLLVENYNDALKQTTDSHPTGQKFVKKLLESTRIHFLPSLNPDGNFIAVPGCEPEPKSLRGRFNANNFDLNRNFPNIIDENKVDAGTQNETRALMDWAKSKKKPVVLSANFQGGSLVASYPYDIKVDNSIQSNHTPDEELFKHLALTYAKNHPSMSSNETCWDHCSDHSEMKIFPNGTTNGAERYSFNGSMSDWLYKNTNSFDITVELGCNMYPNESMLPVYWNENKRPLLKFLLEAHKGLKGIVTDAQTNQKLANVAVHVIGNEHNVTTTEFGDYFRPLKPAHYQIKFVKTGYVDQIVDIDIDDRMAKRLDIKMTRNKPAHSLLISILIALFIACLIILAMAGGYVAQRRRTKRSQSMQMQTIRKADTSATLTRSHLHSSSLASGEHRNVAL